MDQREIIGELKEGEPVKRELHRHFDPDSAMELANKLAEMMQEKLNQHQ